MMYNHRVPLLSTATRLPARECEPWQKRRHMTASQGRNSIVVVAVIVELIVFELLDVDCGCTTIT